MSKKTYVNDTVALTALLNDVQGRATTRTITAHEVQALMKQAEKRLTELGVTREQQRQGVEVFVRTPPVNASNVRNESFTMVWLERNTVGWYVARAHRLRYFNIVPSGQDFLLVIPKEVQQQVTSKALRSLGVSFI